MKTRDDFVSNSSSSSYIIDVGILSHKDAAKLIADNIGDGEDEVGNNWLLPLLEDNVALTCVEIHYHFKDAEFGNNIPAGICVRKDVLREYFDADGNVRADLDKRETVEKFSWYAADGNDYGENEFAVYDAREWAMAVDEHTVKFTEWLIAACKDLCGEEHVALGIDDGDAVEQAKNLEEVKKSLAEKNSVYYIMTCYGGDPDCGLYVADYDDDNNGWKRLRSACKKMMHAAYG